MVWTLFAEGESTNGVGWAAFAIAACSAVVTVFNSWNTRKTQSDKLKYDEKLAVMEREIEHAAADRTALHAQNQACEERARDAERRLDECRDQHEQTRTAINKIKSDCATVAMTVAHVAEQVGVPLPLKPAGPVVRET